MLGCSGFSGGILPARRTRVNDRLQLLPVCRPPLAWRSLPPRRAVPQVCVGQTPKASSVTRPRRPTLRALAPSTFLLRPCRLDAGTAGRIHMTDGSALEDGHLRSRRRKRQPVGRRETTASFGGDRTTLAIADSTAFASDTSARTHRTSGRRSCMGWAFTPAIDGQFAGAPHASQSSRVWRSVSLRVPPSAGGISHL